MAGRLHGSFTLDSDLYKELDRRAEEQDESRSEVVNQLLRKAIDQDRKERATQALVIAGWAIAALVALLLTAAGLVL